MGRLAMPLLLMLVCLPGCEDCPGPTSCDYGSLSLLEGTISGGGRPVSARLRLECRDQPALAGDITTSTDSCGHYEFAVPRGDYYFHITAGGETYRYAAGGLVTSIRDADTLKIGPNPRRIDFSLGALELNVLLDEGWEGAYMSCAVWMREDDELLGITSRGGRVEVSRLTLSFPFLPPGIYRMCLDLGSRCKVWLPRQLSWTEADSITVSRQSWAVYETDLSSVAQIKGQISGSWMTLPIHSSPYVRAFTATDSVEMGQVRTDDSGHYRIPCMDSVPLKLLVSLDDICQWIGGTSFANATTITPEPGQTIEGIDFTGSGIVCYLSGPGVFSNHRVWYRLINYGGEAIHVGGGHGSSLGPACFANLSPGTYYLFMERDNRVQPWFSQWYDQAESLEAATPIVIASAGETVEITAHLLAGGQIHGRVQHPNGNPCTGAGIVVRSVDGSFEDDWAGSTHPIDGSFEILGLSNGEYYVGVRLPYGWRSWFPGTSDPEFADTVRVEEHGIVSSIDWQY